MQTTPAMRENYSDQLYLLCRLFLLNSLLLNRRQSPFVHQAVTMDFNAHVPDRNINALKILAFKFLKTASLRQNHTPQPAENRQIARSPRPGGGRGRGVTKR
jgi:hypothetical protein